MIIEEFTNQQYGKTTDTVERYLIKLVNDYFAANTPNISLSRDSIINRAVQRMKEEINYDKEGVISIKFPDGTTASGDVTITLDKLGGEPLIQNKGTAFNVNFGTEANTVCEGNDPRLSDKRAPKSHTHKESDIPGLTDLKNSINRMQSQSNTPMHTHSNADILDRIVYNGSGPIDLGKLDSTVLKAQEQYKELDKKISEGQKNFDTIQKKIDDETAQLNNTINNSKTELNLLYQEAYDTAKNEFDKIINDLTANSSSDESYIKKSSATQAITDTYTLLAKYTFAGLDKEVNVDNSFIKKLEQNNLSLKDCILDYKVELSTGEICALPSPIFNLGGNMIGYITGVFKEPNTLKITAQKSGTENITFNRAWVNILGSAYLT